jgi:hypothetical protein
MSAANPQQPNQQQQMPQSQGGKPTIFPLFLSSPDSGSFLTSTFNVLSFYAPIIVIIGVFILSVFSASVGKSFVYIFWFFVATGIRSLIKKFTGDGSGSIKGDPICGVGVFEPFLTNTNLSYSTFSLAFTMFYFIFPMILVNIDNKSNMFNYRIVLFFSFYIVFDLFIKRARRCMENVSITALLGDLVGGVALGIGSSATMYYTKRSYLFINEASSTAEMCSMPSKQKFKCSVTKNGELVSTTIV